MAKFILLYKGLATPQSEITPEVGAQLMQAWNSWMGKVGTALVDAGAPFAGNSTAVVADGSTRSASDLKGNTIVEDNYIDTAKALDGVNPSLDNCSARFAFEIYELVTM